jgi:hypothetical protein
MSAILLRETAPLHTEICALLLFPSSPVRPHRAYLSAMPHLRYKSHAASTSTSSSLLQLFPNSRLLKSSLAVRPATPLEPPVTPSS